MDDRLPLGEMSVPWPGEPPADCVARVAGLAEIRRTKFDGGEMVWRVWGTGRPLVLLHGGYGAWSHWIRNVLPLAGHFQVIAADLPSHGESDTLPGRPSREVMAQAVGQGLRQLIAPDKVYDLAGFSMGANLSAAVAAVHGGRLGTLVAVGPGGLGVESQRILGLKRWHPRMPPAELDVRHRNNLGVIMFHDAAAIDPLAVHLQRENGLRMRFRVLRTGINTMLRDYLPEVDARLVSIWGAHDVYAEEGRAARIAVMRRSHPALKVALVPDAGHWVMYEAAAAFNVALLEQLMRDGG